MARDIVILDTNNVHQDLKVTAVTSGTTMTRLGTELLRRALELNLSDELVYPTLIEQAKQQGQLPAEYLMALVTEKMG